MNLKREIINAVWSLWPRSVATMVDGTRFRIPLQRGFDRRVLHHAREPWLDELFRRECAAAGAVLLDVGANCGQTLLKAKALASGVRYVGFEPNPACVGYVQALIALNGLSDCRIFACALGAERGEAELHLNSPADPAGTVIANFRGAETGPVRVPVLVEKGDEMVARLGLTRIDLIKIDAEGAEAEIIAGLRGTIEKLRPTLVCELLRSHDPTHPTHDLRQASKREIAATLGPLGYRFYPADQPGAEPVADFSDSCLNYVMRPDL